MTMYEMVRVDSRTVHYKGASEWDLYLLGLTIVLGGQVFSWNKGLQSGFWEYFTSTLLIGTAYMCLILCLAEMTSALPFSGGCYGFVRVSVGPLWGFIVACCEVIQNILYVSASVMPFGEMMSKALGTHSRYEPLWWLFFFVTAGAIQTVGGKWFWRFNYIMGLGSLILLLLFIFGAFKYVDFEKFSGTAHEDETNFHSMEFYKFMPFSSWFYIGVEMLPLAAIDSNEPKNDIPRAMVACMSTLFITSFAVLFTTCSMSPGTSGLTHELLPLNYGYSHIFGISTRLSTWLSIPATYATGFGFMFAYGRQMASMANSGLLPAFLRRKTRWDTPYMAMAVGSLIAFLVILPIYYSDRTFMDDMFFWSISGSYLVYIFAFSSFLNFRKKYSILNRSFINPIGTISAYYGMIVFAMSLISTLAFQGTALRHRLHPPFGFFTFMLCAMWVYVTYSRKYQCFSDEEQKVMFSAYVINANLRGRRKMKAYQQDTASVLSGGHTGGSGHHHYHSPTGTGSGTRSTLLSRRSSDQSISLLRRISLSGIGFLTSSHSHSNAHISSPPNGSPRHHPHGHSHAHSGNTSPLRPGLHSNTQYNTSTIHSIQSGQSSIHSQSVSQSVSHSIAQHSDTSTRLQVLFGITGSVNGGHSVEGSENGKLMGRETQIPSPGKSDGEGKSLFGRYRYRGSIGGASVHPTNETVVGTTTAVTNIPVTGVKVDSDDKGDSIGERSLVDESKGEAYEREKEKERPSPVIGRSNSGSALGNSIEGRARSPSTALQSSTVGTSTVSGKITSTRSMINNYVVGDINTSPVANTSLSKPSTPSHANLYHNRVSTSNIQVLSSEASESNLLIDRERDYAIHGPMREDSIAMVHPYHQPFELHRGLVLDSFCSLAPGDNEIERQQSIQYLNGGPTIVKVNGVPGGSGGGTDVHFFTGTKVTGSGSSSSNVSSSSLTGNSTNTPNGVGTSMNTVMRLSSVDEQSPHSGAGYINVPSHNRRTSASTGGFLRFSGMVNNDPISGTMGSGSESSANSTKVRSLSISDRIFPKNTVVATSLQALNRIVPILHDALFDDMTDEVIAQVEAIRAFEPHLEEDGDV